MIIKKIFLLFFFLTITFWKSQYSYIIGDSQSLYISKYSKHAQLLKPLYKIGIGVKELNSMLLKSPIYNDTKNVFVSIGVNDSYYDLGISSLIYNLKNVFPNSHIFFFFFSFGWGNVSNISNDTERYIQYYNQFRKYNIYVLDQDIGFGDPHYDKWEYKEIGNYIDYIIYINWKREIL